MTTATLTKHLSIVAKAPTGEGTFEGLIDANPPEGDSDGERFGSFSNIPTTVPLLYQHAYGDPGSEIGTAHVLSKGDDRHLIVLGRLDLESSMGRAVHERMLLPSTDSMSLKELSVGFSLPTKNTWKDRNGVRVLEDAELLEVSVVYKGAQTTSVSNVKGRYLGLDGPDNFLADEAAELDRARLERNAAYLELAEYKSRIDEAAASSRKESTSTRTLRNHLDSSHAQGVRAFPAPLADLIARHRVLHASTGPTEETHIRTGLPYGDTIPVNTTGGTRSYDAIRADVERDARVDEYVRQAKADAERDRLVAVAQANIDFQVAGPDPSLTLAEFQEAEAQREAWEQEKFRVEQEQRDRERAEDIAFLEGLPQGVTDFQAAQAERDAQAVRDVLAQETTESFTMQIGPDGQLRDPDDRRSDLP